MKRIIKSMAMSALAVVISGTMFTAVGAAAPQPHSLGEHNGYHQEDQRRSHWEKERQEREWRERQRHEQEMRRRHHESERAWHERQYIEQKRHEENMRRIAHEILDLLLFR